MLFHHDDSHDHLLELDLERIGVLDHLLDLAHEVEGLMVVLGLASPLENLVPLEMVMKVLLELS
jgi:hypothetical protein